MRSAVFEKLNLKDQREIVVLEAPPSFESELKKLAGVTIHRRLEQGATVEFILVFATRRAEVEAAARLFAKAAPGDAVVWVAYPKGTSKRYTCDFNRDSGWDALGAIGFELVRQVAIDEDWTALRFRRVQFIKSLAREPKRALTPAPARQVRNGVPVLPRRPQGRPRPTMKLVNELRDA
jgi:hypothetical protein